MGRHIDEFRKLNFEVLLILGSPIDQAKRYRTELRLPYPVLADPSRGIYQQYGLLRSFFIQRSASLVIDCDGVIRYIRSATNPMVWMSEAMEVLKAIKALRLPC